MTFIPDLAKYTPAFHAPCETGDFLVWSLEKRTAYGAPGHNLMGMHDMIPLLMLSCEYCGDTLALVDDLQQIAEQTRSMFEAVTT